MSTSPFATNGWAHGASSADEAIDSLYSFWPGPIPAPQPLPEAAFSLTLKGTLDGQEALLTARGQTAAEFKANLEAIRGLLDAPAQPTAPALSQPQGQGQLSPQQFNALAMHRPVTGVCPIHQVTMQLNQKDGRSWWSHRTADGQWCKGK